jgi:hypothetical protein
MRELASGESSQHRVKSTPLSRAPSRPDRALDESRQAKGAHRRLLDAKEPMSVNAAQVAGCRPSTWLARVRSEVLDGSEKIRHCAAKH